MIDILILVGFNPADAAQRELILYLMMTSCDLSDQVKPFDSASKAAVCRPFYFYTHSDSPYRVPLNALIKTLLCVIIHFGILLNS